MTAPQDPLAEIRNAFFVECEELLETLQDGLQALQDHTGDDETIHVIFRAVHSIKGGAGAFGLEALVCFAHGFETTLEEVRAGRLETTSEVLAILFQATDHLADLVRFCQNDTPSLAQKTPPVAEALYQLIGKPPPHKDSDPADEKPDFEPRPIDLDLEGQAPPCALEKNHFNIILLPLAELFQTDIEPYELLRCLQDMGQTKVHCETANLPVIEEMDPECPYLDWRISLATHAEEHDVRSVFQHVEEQCLISIAKSEQQTHPPSQPAQKQLAQVTPVTKPNPPAPAQPRTVVRVDLERIERLVNLIGELVINQSILSQSIARSGLSPHSDTMTSMEEYQRLTRDIQETVMMIRAQQVKALFQRMSRIVRETSAALGKDVRLVTEGETTEIDKTIIDGLTEPLTHLMRNAIDHGIEPQDVRLLAKKLSQGQMQLSATHRSGRVIIVVSDDGGGIDRARVKKIAIARGLIPKNASISEVEIDNLLFQPGFSTAPEITDTSGRGVGLDVVRNKIQSLGGRITLHSEPKQGCRFIISLPLTLAVLDGMVIRVASETMVLPIGMVMETKALNHDDVKMLRPDEPVVRLRDAHVPLLDLGHVLGYETRKDSFEDCVILLISKENGDLVGFVVDDIIDQRQVVIKGLDNSLYRAPGITAATILGDGQIALIIDPLDIIADLSSPQPSPAPCERATA